MEQDILLEVIQTSKDWVNKFNTQDFQGCAEGYEKDAIMSAKPFGTYNGRDAILEFWKNLMHDKGAKDLKYSNIKLQVINQHTVELSANWSMNIGGGVITKELWVLNNEKKWKLIEDHFEVVQ